MGTAYPDLSEKPDEPTWTAEECWPGDAPWGKAIMKLQLTALTLLAVFLLLVSWQLLQLPTWTAEPTLGGQTPKGDRLGNCVMSIRSPSCIDLHIGSRIRERRALIGVSQEKLGAALGVTFQQVQKYEKGSNRVSAGRLFEIAQVLRVPVHYFFDGLETVSKDLGPPEEQPGV